jgi:hypothetical protein
MNKTCFLIIFLFFISIGASNSLFSQEIEFGGNLDFVFPNIINTRISSSEGRAAVGKSLFNLSKGFSFIYNFKGAESETSSGIQVEYQSFYRGSRSENCSDCQYKIQSENINIYYRNMRRYDNGWRVFVDLGIGVNKLDDSNIYFGSEDEEFAFPKMRTPLNINSQEYSFLFDLGVEKVFFKQFVTSFRFISGNIAFTRINQGGGSFQNQGLGFGFSARYLLNVKKQKIK